MRTRAIPLAIIAAVLLTAGFVILEYDVLAHFTNRSPDVLFLEIEEALILAGILIAGMFIVWYRRSRAYRLELERRLKAETEARRALELALLDPLTGLANRRHFEEIFRAAAEPGLFTKHALVLLDLNDFKPVNDVYGHPIGDEVLRIISMRLNNAVKRNDLVSRLGGDEFSIIVFEVDSAEAAMEVAQRLTDIVAEPIAVAGKLLNVSTSIGFTLFPDDGRSPAEIYARADEALYAAKARKHEHRPVHR
ncbi:diguanylate cyclase domain-containing protein [Acuticoccus sediminis]|uniref:diguanylate cyclase domain-containing protein n=1 Tax=Acuticoccus sediminis TaxID=2184697 RepID=UPI001CFF0340|nr:GGDEF domain-containing protein [Acuticoccus sediminis]